MNANVNDFIFVASFDFMIEEVLQNENENILTKIGEVAKKYENHDITDVQLFDPWVYIAGYSFSRDLYWENDTLNEEMVCLAFISYGYRAGFKRNLLGGVCTRDVAEKILHKTAKICIVGNCPLSEETRKEINDHDIVVRCNRADNFNPDIDKVDYLVYRTVIFDQSPKFKNKMKSAISCSKVIAEIDGSLEGPSDKLKLRLKKFQAYFPLLVENLVTEYNYKKKKSHIKKPSTGFCAIQMILQLYPLADVNLYGFTFNGTYHHNWKFEKSYCDKTERIIVK